MVQAFDVLITALGVEPPDSETVDLTSLWPLAVALLGRLLYVVLSSGSL